MGNVTRHTGEERGGWGGEEGEKISATFFSRIVVLYVRCSSSRQDRNFLGGVDFVSADLFNKNICFVLVSAAKSVKLSWTLWRSKKVPPSLHDVVYIYDVVNNA